MDNEEIKKIQKKWEVALNFPSELSDETIDKSFDNIGFPKILGSEPKSHRKKRERFEKMKTLLGDDFFNVVDKKEYEDFINEEFLPSATTIARDLVSVQPMSAPSGEIFYMDFKYESEYEKNKRLMREKQELRMKKMKEILK